jgi:exosortase
MSDTKTASGNNFSRTGSGTILLLVLVFGCLWFVLINQLRVEWTLNPQYSYGWAVPVLCAYLIWQRVRKPETGFQRFRISAFTFFQRPLPSVFCLLILAFLYAPTRLIEEANPEWHLVSWALAVEVIGLTLLFLHFNAPTLQRFNLSICSLIFPICFFFVAVPWPSVFEGPLIQSLTRADVRATVELLGWLGLPAMPHGNVIEVATGEVGISEACSGIRSFQATLMISLFLGELYRLSVLRRSILCLGGFAMSFLFNIARMSLLVWVASKKGIAAIETWHDPAGVTILVACFCGLWGLGEWFGKKQKATISKSEVENRKSQMAIRPDAISPSTFNVQPSTVRKLIFALAAWIILTEIGVETWYRSHEARLPPATQWTVNWPTNNPTFKEMPLDEKALQILQCDEHGSAGWRENDLQWQTIFIQWNPGTFVQLGHTPNICMTGAGHTLATVSNSEWFDAGDFHLPFIVYEVTDTPRPFYIFYCMWNDRLSADGFGETFLRIYGNRLAPVLTGVRNAGQRSLEIAVDGVNSADEAESAVREELRDILAADSTTALQK